MNPWVRSAPVTVAEATQTVLDDLLAKHRKAQSEAEGIRAMARWLCDHYGVDVPAAFVDSTVG